MKTMIAVSLGLMILAAGVAGAEYGGFQSASVTSAPFHLISDNPDDKMEDITEKLGHIFDPRVPLALSSNRFTILDGKNTTVTGVGTRSLGWNYDPILGEYTMTKYFRITSTQEGKQATICFDGAVDVSPANMKMVVKYGTMTDTEHPEYDTYMPVETGFEEVVVLSGSDGSYSAEFQLTFAWYLTGSFSTGTAISTPELDISIVVIMEDAE